LEPPHGHGPDLVGLGGLAGAGGEREEGEWNESVQGAHDGVSGSGARARPVPSGAGMGANGSARGGRPKKNRGGRGGRGRLFSGSSPQCAPSRRPTSSSASSVFSAQPPRPPRFFWKAFAARKDPGMEDQPLTLTSPSVPRRSAAPPRALGRPRATASRASRGCAW